jgi:hypothetical protein
MTTTELIGPPEAPDAVERGGSSDPSQAREQASDVPVDARSSALEHPAHDEGLEELVAVISVVPGEGPLVILLAGPLVLFALALAGPFLVLLTFVALLAACALLVALAGAIVAAPYLLVRRIGGYRLPRSRPSAPAARFIPVDSGRRSA